MNPEIKQYISDQIEYCKEQQQIYDASKYAKDGHYTDEQMTGYYVGRIEANTAILHHFFSEAATVPKPSQYCKKVIITDKPETWPQNDIPPNYTVCHTDEYGDKSLIWFQLSARIKKGEQLGAWWWLKPIDLDAKYKEWCKATGRNGGILVHGSIQEFFKWLKEEEK